MDYHQFKDLFDLLNQINDRLGILIKSQDKNDIEARVADIEGRVTELCLQKSENGSKTL